MAALTARVSRLRERSRLADVLYRTMTEARLDGERRLAAEVTYYAFFSLFPLLLLFVTVLDVMVSEKQREQIVDSVVGQFPVIGHDILDNVASPQGRSVAAAVGLLTALWAGSHAFESFEHAIAVVWRGPAVAPISMVKSRLRAFATMGVLGLAVLATTIVGSLLATINVFPLLMQPLSLVITVALNTGVILLCFKICAPGNPRWREQVPGAVVGAVGWTVLQVAGGYFVRYVVKGASDTYGTFAVVIGLLTWINIQVRLILYAAELNSVLARGPEREGQPSLAG